MNDFIIFLRCSNPSPSSGRTDFNIFFYKEFRAILHGNDFGSRITCMLRSNEARALVAAMYFSVRVMRGPKHSSKLQKIFLTVRPELGEGCELKLFFLYYDWISELAHPHLLE